MLVFSVFWFEQEVSLMPQLADRQKTLSMMQGLIFRV
jgi:hypothetical protein